MLLVKNLTRLDINRRLSLWEHIPSKINRAFYEVDAALAYRGIFITSRFKKLTAYKNIHQGTLGVLIGNGPSVRIQDLESLKGFTTFTCNRFYLAYPQTSFRPSYLISSDPQMILDFGNEMISKAEVPVWFIDNNKPSCIGECLYIRLREANRVRLRKNVMARIFPSGATLISALQIGYFMGIRKFALYGVDHSFTFRHVSQVPGDPRTATGDGNHFIPGYRSSRSWCPPRKELIEKGFVECAEQLRKEGGFLVNCTRGGKLDVLPRVELDTLLTFFLRTVS